MLELQTRSGAEQAPPETTWKGAGHTPPEDAEPEEPLPGNPVVEEPVVPMPLLPLLGAPVVAVPLVDPEPLPEEPPLVDPESTPVRPGSTRPPQAATPTTPAPITRENARTSISQPSATRAPTWILAKKGRERSPDCANACRPRHGCHGPARSQSLRNLCRI